MNASYLLGGQTEEEWKLQNSKAKLVIERVRQRMEAKKKLEAAHGDPAVEEEEKEIIYLDEDGFEIKEDQHDEEDEFDDEMRVLTPAECSEKLDEHLESKMAIRGKRKRRLDFRETQAFVFAIKKQHRWVQKRNAIDALRKSAGRRNTSDSSFAREIGLKGGAAEYIREMDRLSLAKEVFVDNMMPFVIWLARDFWESSGVPRADLHAVCRRALLRAALVHDPALGFKFSTLAAVLMEHAMSEHIKKTHRTIRLPITVESDIIKMHRLRRHLQAEDIDPGLQDPRLAMAMDISQKRLGFLKSVEQYIQTHFLFDTVYDSEGRVTRHDVTASPDTPLIEKLVQNLRNLQISRILDLILTEREATVLKMRFGFHDELGTEISIEEIARVLKISPGKAKEVEKMALMKLRPI